MTRKLLHIIPTLDQGGAEKQMVMLATGLPRDRFETHVCVLTRDGPLGQTLTDAGIEYTVINKRWKIDPSAYGRLKRHIAKVKPDIVHTWLFAANSYGRYAASRCGVKCIIGAERCVDSWKRSYELSIDRWLAKRTNRIVCNSSAIRDFYAGKKFDAGLFEVIHNGVQQPDAIDEAGRSKRKQKLLNELGLPADTILIGAIGRLWPQKRVKDLIWAADLLKCIRDDIHLLIVGDGPQRWRLERFRDQVEIRDRVHFLGHRNDAGEIISTLDCLWLASAYEGQSNVILEAMAAGVPVVATDIPGTRDLVVPDETGYLVQVGDRAGFAKRTRLLFETDDLWQRFSTNSRQRISEQFSVDQMIRNYVEMYDACCE